MISITKEELFNYIQDNDCLLVSNTGIHPLRMNNNDFVVNDPFGRETIIKTNSITNVLLSEKSIIIQSEKSLLPYSILTIKYPIYNKKEDNKKRTRRTKEEILKSKK